MEAQPAIKQSRLMPSLALLVFFVVGFILASPCLCLEGVVGGNIKLAFFVLVFCRLAWCIYKRTFRFVDYIVYFIISIVFDFWVESHY
jgi:hypothetical protein